MKTKQEILKETYDYYSQDPSRRGKLNTQTCTYYTQDGNMCAVGRCLINPQERLDDTSTVTQLDLEKELKPEYRGHEVEFWSLLQQWHDDNEHFTDTGVSELGKRVFEELKSMYEVQ